MRLYTKPRAGSAKRAGVSKLISIHPPFTAGRYQQKQNNKGYEQRVLDTNFSILLAIKTINSMVIFVGIMKD